MSGVSQSEVCMSESADTIRVLHVDDEPDLVDMAATFLEREDNRIDVRTANSPTDGLEVLADYELDCIVSDYDMPQTNGIEFLEAVREESPELPFILYTGKGSEEIASEAITAGVTDYLQKQSGTEQYELLANGITNVVSQYRATKAAERAQRRLRELAEKTHDVLWMFSAGWEDLLFVNSSYEKIWGQDTEHLREQPGSFLDAVHPNDRKRTEQAMQHVSEGEPQEIEIRVNPDEEYQRHVWIQAEPIFNESKDVVRIVGFTRDITDRKEREQRYNAIFNQTYQFTGLLEPDGTLIEANETALEFGGIDRDDVIGKKCGKQRGSPILKRPKNRHKRLSVAPRMGSSSGMNFRSKVSIEKR